MNTRIPIDVEALDEIEEHVFVDVRFVFPAGVTEDHATVLVGEIIDTSRARVRDLPTVTVLQVSTSNARPRHADERKGLDALADRRERVDALLDEGPDAA